MANYGKRMVPEYLIKTLEGVDKKIQGDADNINLMENIVDSNGNKRFVEGNITIDTLSGVTQTYGKWSLSGSHLMIVIALQIASGTALTTSDRVAILSLPSWVVGKIKAIYGNYVSRNTFPGIGAGTDHNYEFTLRKISDIISVYYTNFTTTRAENIRIQFDLVIDNE